MFLIKGKKVKGGRNMPITTLVLYLIYMIVGICTLRLLTKYKMKVARIAYAVASFVFMLYLPVYAGNELMAEFLSSLLAPFSYEPVVDALREPLVASTPYLTGSFAVGIVISVFICLSAVSVALTAISVYRSIRKKRKTAHRATFTHTQKKYHNDLRTAPAGRRACAVFCRYNC